MHAAAVLTDTAQRHAERRIRDAPRQKEHDEQDAERIGIGSRAEDIEFEMAEQLAGTDTLQAVGAASQAACAIGRFGE